YVVHNLNRDPMLPFDANRFGAIVVTVSIQYLTQPIEVFQQAHRVLETSGFLIVVFSNRMFPTKAVSIWHAMPDGQHQQLVKYYFDIAGNYENVQCLDITTKCEGYTDPVYVVMGQKG
ncbi:MAG: methyltransferase domain-containing protein, partial [Candidatus Poribacteria bacterium]|nr:methyltransferase domain-containing protein [Candidatus Poribacteria bacterium]